MAEGDVTALVEDARQKLADRERAFADVSAQVAAAARALGEEKERQLGAYRDMVDDEASVAEYAAALDAIQGDSGATEGRGKRQREFAQQCKDLAAMREQLPCAQEAVREAQDYARFIAENADPSSTVRLAFKVKRLQDELHGANGRVAALESKVVDLEAVVADLRKSLLIAATVGAMQVQIEDLQRAPCRRCRFVGFVKTTFSGDKQTMEEIDAQMDEACASKFHGARAASGLEFMEKRIDGMPGNCSDGHLVFRSPGNAANPHASSRCGWYFSYVSAGSALNGTLHGSGQSNFGVSGTAHVMAIQ